MASSNDTYPRNIPCDQSQSTNNRPNSLSEETRVKEVIDRGGKRYSVGDPTSIPNFERRISCETLESHIEELKKIAGATLSLPKNEGRAFECSLHKVLTKEDAYTRIDRLIAQVKNQAEEWGRQLKAHVDTHRFVEIRATSGRKRSLSEAQANKLNNITDKADSAYDSKEILPEIHNLSFGEDSEPSSVESTSPSGTCNVCLGCGHACSQCGLSGN